MIVTPHKWSGYMAGHGKLKYNLCVWGGERDLKIFLEYTVPSIDLNIDLYGDIFMKNLHQVKNFLSNLF